MSKVHIGKKIEDVAKKSGLSVIKVAKLLNMTRDAIYKIYEKEFIDTDLLRKISVALQHDFFKYFSEELPIVVDPIDSFGFATKEELTALQHSIEAIIKKEMALFRAELLKEKNSYLRKTPRKKTK